LADPAGDPLVLRLRRPAPREAAPPRGTTASMESHGGMPLPADATARVSCSGRSPERSSVAEARSSKPAESEAGDNNHAHRPKCHYRSSVEGLACLVANADRLFMYRRGRARRELAAAVGRSGSSRPRQPLAYRVAVARSRSGSLPRPVVLSLSLEAVAKPESDDAARPGFAAVLRDSGPTRSAANPVEASPPRVRCAVRDNRTRRNT